MRKNKLFLIAAGLGLGCGLFLVTAQIPEGTQAPDAKKKSKRPPRPGVTTPGVRREMSSITPLAVFDTGGTPDWQVVTNDAIWVANGPKNTVHRLDAKTNTIAATVTVGDKPCSGLTTGFGSVWVPNCGSQTVSRVKMADNTIEATVPRWTFRKRRRNCGQHRCNLAGDRQSRQAFKNRSEVQRGRGANRYPGKLGGGVLCRGWRLGHDAR